MPKEQLKLSDFPLQTRIPVQWNDMDAAAHVNNLVYLRWCETARVEYFEKMKMNISFRGAGTGPILSYQDGKYIFPMTYPDVAIIGTRTLEVLKDRFVLQAGVFSEKHKRIAAISTQVIVPYDYELLRKVDLPAEWVEAIERIES
ncbi:acyl-ACP thioesterase [Lewinellaceae bacterium SD302]|nr:acyl-ACP thioesterase [Lewinellaceae bacterium SD302]